MKTISIRQLAAYNKDLLKDLPLTLTRYNIPFAVILSVEEYEKLKKENENK